MSKLRQIILERSRKVFPFKLCLLFFNYQYLKTMCCYVVLFYEIMKKKYFISVSSFGLVLFVLFPYTIQAQVVINEVMYDVSGTDTGREWIEVYNSGSESVDLSAWKLFEANTNHKLTALGDTNLPAGGYAIFVDNSDKFLADYPSFNGLIFDSVFSLSNTGETLILRNINNIDVDTFTYDGSLGANGDGGSLQKNSSSWIAGIPTPGIVNTTTVIIPSPDIGSGATTASSTPSLDTGSGSTTSGSSGGTSIIWSSHSSQSVAYTGNDEVVLGISAGRDRLASVGSVLAFEGRVRTPNNIDSSNVSFTWSFGDGTSGTGRFIDHTYLFPGEYTIVVNGNYQNAHAVAKVLVRVVETSLMITANTDEFIELTNKGKNEINVGGWIFESGNKNFIIPQDTIINTKQSVKIPRVVTGLSLREIKMFDASKKFVASRFSAGYADVNVGQSVVATAVPLEKIQITGITKEDLEKRLAAVFGMEGERGTVPEPEKRSEILASTQIKNTDKSVKNSVSKDLVNTSNVSNAAVNDTGIQKEKQVFAGESKTQTANVLFTVDEQSTQDKKDSSLIVFIKRLFGNK